MDDGLKSVLTAEDAIELLYIYILIDKDKKMCSNAGIHLHFFSNLKVVLDHIPQEDLAKGLKDLDLVHDALAMERVLDIQWCT